MKAMLFGLSMFLRICSRAGRVNHAMRRATFLNLRSGSKYSSIESVTTVYTSMYPFLYLPLSFSSWQGKTPHELCCNQMFMSYWRPRWNLPTIALSDLLPLIYSATKVGICCMISIKDIDGRQSSSFFGITCKSKSLPSAKEGVQNLVLVMIRGG